MTPLLTWCCLTGRNKPVRECKGNSAVCECGTYEYRCRQQDAERGSAAPTPTRLCGCRLPWGTCDECTHQQIINACRRAP